MGGIAMELTLDINPTDILELFIMLRLSVVPRPSYCSHRREGATFLMRTSTTTDQQTWRTGSVKRRRGFETGWQGIRNGASA